LKELLTAGPHLSASGTKKKRGERVGPAGEAELGQLGPAYACGRKRPTAWDCSRAERKRKGRGKRNGPAREKEREEREKVFSFFKILFKFVFQTFKFQSNRNPCIRIMMHKHLLFLNYFSDV
jgi:hypothetical protein